MHQRRYFLPSNIAFHTAESIGQDGAARSKRVAVTLEISVTIPASLDIMRTGRG